MRGQGYRGETLQIISRDETLFQHKNTRNILLSTLVAFGLYKVLKRPDKHALLFCIKFKTCLIFVDGDVILEPGEHLEYKYRNTCTCSSSNY